MKLQLSPISHSTLSPLTERRSPEQYRTPSPSRTPNLLRFSSSVKAELRDLKLTRLKHDLLELSTSRQRIKHKQHLLDILERSHKVTLKPIDCRKFSEKQLVSLAAIKRRKQLAATAASKIRTFTSSQRVIREVSCQSQREAAAAIVIQRNWKRFRLAETIHIRIRRRHEAATCIQKHFRGYIVRKDFELLKKKAYQRISKNYDYFKILRSKLLAESSNVISKHWLQYKASKLPPPPPPVDLEVISMSRKRSSTLPSKVTTYSNQTNQSRDYIERGSGKNSSKDGSPKLKRRKTILRKNVT
eukprot:CAMPEP_0204903008 /NCGR_PEP_ID=MMETSP1397-20131031/4002_1 /ASSEMBLY_ACC=CAM_ASM_000891 /TAXON_ID=49980 /ORGANISM="Climacostomum Climacostomum virens, Strain Stock W-24" /LENGTH=300 /DNA_ID=CAMNT_0052071585 /DNA_START=269 /DNA_END=1168 /DNA_ORIENTATION=-